MAVAVGAPAALDPRAARDRLPAAVGLAGGRRGSSPALACASHRRPRTGSRSAGSSRSPDAGRRRRRRGSGRSPASELPGLRQAGDVVVERVDRRQQPAAAEAGVARAGSVRRRRHGRHAAVEESGDDGRAASSQSCNRPRGRVCFSSSTGANRSPCFSIRFEHVVRLEAKLVLARRAGLDLVPGDGRRDRRALTGAQRVDGDRRLRARVLRPVHQHLADPQLLGHLRDDEVGLAPARAPARPPGRTAWCARTWCGRSAARRPGGPSSRSDLANDSSPSPRTARAPGGRPRSTRGSRRAGPGRGRRPSRSAPPCSAPSRARGAARAPRSGRARSASACSSQTTKSISPARSKPTRAVFTQSGAPFGARFS